MPIDLMDSNRCVQSLPEVLVLDLLLPPTRFPGIYPLRDAIAHVLRIRIERNFASLFKPGKRLNCRLKFHSIISRCELAAKELLA